MDEASFLSQKHHFSLHYRYLSSEIAYEGKRIFYIEIIPLSRVEKENNDNSNTFYCHHDDEKFLKFELSYN